MVKQKRLTYLDLACQTSRKRLCSKMRRFGDLAANNCPQIMVFDWADSYRYFGVVAYTTSDQPGHSTRLTSKTW